MCVSPLYYDLRAFIGILQHMHYGYNKKTGYSKLSVVATLLKVNVQFRYAIHDQGWKNSFYELPIIF
jgi:hypothetical protein